MLKYILIPTFLHKNIVEFSIWISIFNFSINEYP